MSTHECPRCHAPVDDHDGPVGDCSCDQPVEFGDNDSWCGPNPQPPSGEREIAELVERLRKRAVPSSEDMPYNAVIRNGPDDFEPGYDAELDMRSATALESLAAERDALQAACHKAHEMLVDEYDGALDGGCQSWPCVIDGLRIALAIRPAERKFLND